MSRGASGTTTWMELSTTKDNRDTMRDKFPSQTLWESKLLHLKNMLQITIKVKQNDKITYTLLVYRETW